jgi:D-amino-acid dehydrogenase
MAGDSYVWNTRREMGVVFEDLSSSDLQDLEPDLAGDFGCGRRLKGWHHVSDPGRLTTGLVERFSAQGGTYRKAEAKALERGADGRATLRLADGSSLEADEIVLAAGPWMRHLAGDLKSARLVESLAGYGVDLPDTGIGLRRKVVYPKGGFVISPLADVLRVAGTVEIAGIDPVPDYGRAETILRKARRVLPNLNPDAGERWMRQRPFMPDTLPVIDRAPGYENVILATGHGQLGLTLGGVTGRLVADLVAGRKPPLDLKPLSARRFG